MPGVGSAAAGASDRKTRTGVGAAPRTRPSGHTTVARKSYPSCGSSANSKTTRLPDLSGSATGPTIARASAQHPPGVAAQSRTPQPSRASQARTVPSSMRPASHVRSARIGEPAGRSTRRTPGGGAMQQGASGHVFVVHGRVETVVHDAAVVPTDDGFGVSATWNPVLEVDDPASLRPSAWPCDGHGRAGDRPVWFISVGDGDGLATDLLVERAVGVVHDVAAARIPPASNRVKPVLAMPVLGLEGGGHDRDRGDVVKALLEALHAAVAGVDLDIAVVTPDASVYAAAQHVRSRIDPGTVGPELAEHAQRLGLLARSGDLALFLDAGVSMPAGLPAWREMLRLLGERTHGLTDVDPLRLSPLDQ